MMKKWPGYLFFVLIFRYCRLPDVILSLFRLMADILIPLRALM